MTRAVVLDGVTKRFGATEALAGLSLRVAAGERLALLGHNGAGKTTLIKLMLGLVAPSSGHVAVLGERPGDVASPSRRSIGFLPEAVRFHEAMTGEETLRFYARLKGWAPAEGGALLERVGLAAAARARVSTYSKGMRQRLGLAQALLGRPRLLLLDEPTTGLDPELRQIFYDILHERAEQGAAVILSSHLLTELEARTDRIVILDHGRLVAEGTLEGLRHRAGLPVVIRASGADGTSVLQVTAAGKLEALRRVLARPDLMDVALTEPGLDTVYRHFCAHPAEAATMAPEGIVPSPAHGRGGNPLRPLAILAGKEFRDGLRNRWLLAAGLTLAALALGLAFLGSAPTGHVGAAPLAVTVASLSSLTVFLVPLMALMLAFDAVVGEAERGTLLLLLAYPLRRWQVVAGKFLGHVALLAVAIVSGYGLCGLVVAGQEGGAGWPAFVTLVAAALGLGAGFLALGTLASAVVVERATAAGIAVGLWLGLVLLYDLVLLAILAVTRGQGAVAALFPWVLLADPADVFRLLTLGSFAGPRVAAGLAGLPAAALPAPALLVAALAGWVALPLALAVAACRRRVV